MKITTLVFPTLLSVCLSCSGALKNVEDKGTTAGNTFIACAKADIGQTIPEIGITLLADVTQILMAGSGNYIDALDALGEKYGQEAEACAVKAVETVLTAGNGSGSAAHVAESPAASRAASMIRNKGWQFK